MKVLKMFEAQPEGEEVMKSYRKKALQPMRPYIVGEDLTGISVNKEDTPEIGGMIAVNPKNPEDRWYVAKKFFEENYEEVKPRLMEEQYPCADCGKLRTKAQGGTTFTVCDECWDKHYKKKSLMEECPEPKITFDKSALKDICEMLDVPYDERIIGFTKWGVIVDPKTLGTGKKPSEHKYYMDSDGVAKDAKPSVRG